MAPTIALIHATYAAVSPVESAFTEDWPEAITTSILAEDLTRDLATAGTQTPAIRARMMTLADFAARAGVDGILFTCSAFAESIEAVQNHLSIPVLKPNEAMFEDAIQEGGRIAMLVTFEPAIRSMTEEFTRMTAEGQCHATLETHFVPGALDALNAGQPGKHHDLLAKAAAKFSGYDSLMLAQFSMAGAKPRIVEETGATVLTSPGSAIAKLKNLIMPE